MTTKPIEVAILGQQYLFSCAPEDEMGLREAAFRLDEEMRRIRDANGAGGHDKTLVMAALSLSVELIKLEKSVQMGRVFPAEKIERTIAELNARLEQAV